MFLTDIALFGVALNLFLLAAFTIANAKKITGLFSKIERRWWIALLLVVLLGLSIRLYAPPAHLYYTDGLWNIEAGKNILEKGSAVTCEYAGFEEACLTYRKTMGVQAVYAVAFLFFGAGANAVLSTNLLFGALIPVLVFLIGFLALKNKKAALASALFCALLPGAITVSRFLDNDAPSVFFMLLALLFFLIFLKKKDLGLQILSILALSFAVQTKSSGLLLMPLMAWLLFKNREKVRVWPFALLLIFALPITVQYANYLHISQLIALKTESVSLFGTGYLPKNIALVSGIFLRWLPLALVPLIAAPLPSLFRKKNKAVLFSIAFFLVFFVPPLFLFRMQDRNMLLPFVGLFFLAGNGVVLLEEKIRKCFGNNRHSNAAALAVFALLALSFYPLIIGELQATQKFMEKNGRIILTPHLREIEQGFPENCYMVTREPSLFAGSKIKAIDETYLESNPSFFERVKEKGSCLMYYCEVKKSERIEEQFQLKVFKEYGEKNQKFTVYKITGKK